jgi:Putative beta-barrel porin-2, OmpL-like. bbp2
MKKQWMWSAAAIALVCLSGKAASAQGNYGSYPNQIGSGVAPAVNYQPMNARSGNEVAPISYNLSDGCSDPGCAAGCADPGCGAGGAGMGCADGCAGNGDGCAGDACAGMGECESPYKFGGWLQGGFHTFSDTAFNDRPDKLNLHQAWLFLEKTADGSNGFDWGYRGDYLYGIDAQNTQAFGSPQDDWDTDWDNGAYGHALPQAYGEVAMGDISIKAGHFFTICGYEVVQSPQNFFYSRALTMNYFEPFTHTGGLATMKFGEQVTGYGGWVQGWDTGFSDNGGSMFLGGAALTLTEGATLTYTTTAGKVGFGTAMEGYSHSIVANMQLTERVSSVLAHDLVDFSAAGELRRHYSATAYMFYKLTENVSLGGRYEWLRNEGNSPTSLVGIGDIHGLTGGFNVRLLKNLVMRPEARWLNDQDALFLNPADQQKVGFGVDAVLTF